MPRLRLATAFAAASFLLPPPQAIAQGTVLPESVVTATRVPTLVQRIPAGVTVIDTIRLATMEIAKAMASGMAVGAHVVRVMADEEAGDYGEPEFLGVFGQVPEAA